MILTYIGTSGLEMSVNVLELNSERVSLEFARDEFPTIMSRLRRRGKVSRRQEASFDILEVRGEEFILMDEWDEPCLLSRSPAGDAILRAVAQVRGRSGASSSKDRLSA